MLALILISQPPTAYQSRVSDQFSGQPQEGFLKVIIGLGRYIVVLKVLLAMESDCLCFDFALLHVDLVSGKNDWNVFTHADQIAYTQKFRMQEASVYRDLTYDAN
jgi:hypothetical protein